MPTLDVHFLPQLVDPAKLAGSTCVVIDVLRATTTIVQALAAGAREVIPCLEVEDALRVAATLPAGSFLLGGERGGVKIDGFDLGNSPAEYRAEAVAGKVVVFTTTNGTRAMLACAGADQILCGAFVNVSAICEVLRTGSNINLICAGTDGRITREDVLLAGAIVERLSQSSSRECNDEAQIARVAWQEISQIGDCDLALELSRTRGGQNLIDLGMQADLALAAEYCSLTVVPVYRGNHITPLADDDAQ